MTVAAHHTCYTVRLLSQATLFSFAQIGGGHQTGLTSVSSTAKFHGVMQQRVHDEVKQRMLNLCHGMDHSAIDNATA